MPARPPIQAADPGERRRVLVFLAVMTLLGAAVFSRFDDLAHWVIADPDHTVVRINLLIATLLIPASAIIFVSLRLWRVGDQTLRARRYPPPGQKVIRDTAILEGPASKRRGRQLQWFSRLLATCVLLAPPMLWWLVWRIAGTGAA